MPQETLARLAGIVAMLYDVFWEIAKTQLKLWELAEVVAFRFLVGRFEKLLVEDFDHDYLGPNCVFPIMGAGKRHHPDALLFNGLDDR